MHEKVLRKTEIHLTCVKKDPTVSWMLFLQSSHIYCSPKLLWKRQTVPNSNGVLLRASPAPFQFKALEANLQFKCFIPPPTLPPSPFLSTKFDYFPNTWNEHFEQKHIILSDGDDHNLKAKGEMTYFTWTLWEALGRDVMWPQNDLVAHALGHHMALSSPQSLSQSFLYRLCSGSVYWGLSLNWAWDRGHGMIE